jgi:RNA polymerase sigma factor (sigma-70 family)
MNPIISAEGFERAFNQYATFLYSLAYRLTGCREDAEDLIQETCLKAWRSRKQLSTDNAEPWLRRICINTFIDSSRRKRVPTILNGDFPTTHEIASSDPTPDEQLLVDEEIRSIHSQCFSIVSANLPLYQRIIFVLVDIFQLSIDDAAELIGRSRSATKALLHRAREKMNSFLAPSCTLLSDSNLCRCESWISFAHDSQRRREYLLQILNARDRSDVSMKETKKKLIALFRQLPHLNPPHGWLDEALQSIKKSN